MSCSQFTLMGYDERDGSKMPLRRAMFTALKIKNFKGIQDSGRIELKPLTILTGKNSSGKSSIMEPLALLSQAARLVESHPNEERTLPFVLQLSEPAKFPFDWAQHLTYGKDPKRFISFEVHALPGSTMLQEPKSAEENGSIGYAYSYNAFTQEGSSSIFAEGSKIIDVTREKKNASYETWMQFGADRSRRVKAGVSPLSILESRCFDLPSNLSPVTAVGF